ncbi:MAG: biosynthetic-type acetolactate synthase large subunit [Treponema sp.]|nr:biosynthetic-type acetolactate synthase large subunit [Treponema sp.]
MKREESYTGARILIESLIQEGVDTIFGYPGGAVLDIYDELYRQRKRIKHILVSHEQHAAHGADGYARSSGKVGVCLATSGPGATNLITGIAAAYMDSIPLVSITGNVPRSFLGKDSFQEVDIAGVSMPVVKHNWIIKDLKDMAPVIQEAFIVAQSGRPGPVLIDIPKDILVQSLKGPVWKEAAPRRRARLGLHSDNSDLHQENIARAAAFIQEARYPLILAGGGVISAGASAELKALAERIRAPVAQSLMGIGALPAQHRLCTGLLGLHGTLASGKAARRADLLIALGLRFSDRTLGPPGLFEPLPRVLHFDIDPAEINKNVKTQVALIGDLKKTLAQLLKALQGETKNAWKDEIETWKAQGLKEVPQGGDKTLAPAHVIQEAARKLGRRSIALTDVGQHQIWAAQYFPAQEPRTFLSSGGLGAMGFGLGAALGAKIANPERPVLLFTGDGSFRMNCGELATLRQYKVPILIILFNNGVLGMVRQWQSSQFARRYWESTLAPDPDYVKLGEAYGVPSYRAQDQASYAAALDLALGHMAKGLPVLIEVPIDRDEPVLPFPQVL